jgi:hypothetical protein
VLDIVTVTGAARPHSPLRPPLRFLPRSSPYHEQNKAKSKKQKPHEPGDPQGITTKPNSNRSKS